MAMSIVSFLLALCGFTALAMAMPRHFRAVMKRPPTGSWTLRARLAGWTLLAASLWPCILWLGNPVGLVAWFGVLNVGALLTALGLSAVERK
jgi:hypothetical protein